MYLIHLIKEKMSVHILFTSQEQNGCPYLLTQLTKKY